MGSASHAGGAASFETVAIKTVSCNDDGLAERDALILVQQATSQKSGPHHVTQLLDSYTDPSNNTLTLITRCGTIILLQ